MARRLQEEDMTSFKLFGAALALATIAIAPVSAQEAVQEPGAYAFYHPNADVLNAGRPMTGAAVSAQLPRNAFASTQMSVRTHRAPQTSIRRY
jgi:hypothetical protein